MSCIKKELRVDRGLNGWKKMEYLVKTAGGVVAEVFENRMF